MLSRLKKSHFKWVYEVVDKSEDGFIEKTRRDITRVDSVKSEQQLAASQGPIIAATDYVRALPESVRAFLPPGRSYLTLGTDGFGRSDTRAALRDFFGVDAASIVNAALHQLKAA